MWPEAAELDRRALELNPNYRAALMQLSSCMAVEGNFADAIGYAEQAVALDPRAVPLRDHLMLLYMAVGDIDSARAVNSPPTAAGQLGMFLATEDIDHVADMIYEGKFGPTSVLSPEFFSQFVLRQALSDHDFARALKLLSASLPFAEILPPDAIRWRLLAYANLVQLLDASGDAIAALRLQELIEQRMGAIESSIPRHVLIRHQVQATLLAHAGRTEEACVALEQAYTPAPRLFWKLIVDNPAFDGMRSAPCFQALLTRIEAHIAAERVRIDAMRSEGRIPDRLMAKPERGANKQP